MNFVEKVLIKGVIRSFPVNYDLNIKQLIHLKEKIKNTHEERFLELRQAQLSLLFSKLSPREKTFGERRLISYAISLAFYF